MTPSSAKPEPGLIVDPDAPETDVTAQGDAADADEKPGGARRRGAPVELRVASRRAEGDDGDPKPARGAKTGARSRGRAQYRAAQAALADGQTGDADLDDESDLVEGEPDQRDQFTEIARTTADADLEPPPGAKTGDRTQPGIQLRAPSPTPELIQGEIVTDDDDDDDDRPGGGGRRRMVVKAEKAEKRAAKAAKNNDAANYVVAPAVNMAQLRPRHYGVMAMFVLMVLIPVLSYGLYLWTRAADQYASNVGFASRTEEAPSTFAVLGALSGVSQGGSNDMDILYQFIVSQELVVKLDNQLDLKAMFAKAKDDPLNRFSQGGTIEDLVAYWKRMVVINYDSGTGLMTLQVFAFDPADAQKIAEAILVESTRIINDLSMTAQIDTTRYSKEALTTSEKKLSAARLAVLDFQITNGIVDPTATISTQNSVIGTLNQQLATSQIDLDMLTGTVAANDVRIATLNRRMEVIRNRISEEQAKVGGAADAGSPGFAKLMQEFERLKVDQDFGERAYLTALAAYDQAVNDAQHKTRYLATYVAPTLAEAPTAPNRPLSVVLVALIGFLSWAVVVLIYYALRDRR